MTMAMEWFVRFRDIAGYICCYLTVNLGRSVFFSFALLAAVVLLRKLSFFRNCFQRMILWGCFLWLPFIGGLKFFYETKAGVRGFLWWANWNYEHAVIGQIYFAVMALYGGFLFYRRGKLRCFVKGLRPLAGNVSVCESRVTPFATGLFSPKIVVPEVMVREYGGKELETILLHERMHIRLGHLWCLFLWDVLRVLLWPNFFLTFAMKLLKADLEEMCDQVTIQRGGGNACDYGLLLLKSVRLLRLGELRKLPAQSAAFAGERGGSGYRDMKRRIQRIAGFQGYGTKSVAFILAAGLVVVGGGFLEIHSHSYARYTELEDVTVFDDTGIHVILSDSERLRGAVTFDDHRVYVDVDEMQELLRETGSGAEGIYILFGGFMKQPGVGGCCEMVYADLGDFTGERYVIEYETTLDPFAWVVKML